ncbi:hypothetical protein [Nocardia aobensis]|uniref:hypothetical protein n=1 Tax=Nocardia aobensis TaxID=257277 RepID=UPI001576C5D5|nr:hypothetical protein [Nocardia aobensis]
MAYGVERHRRDAIDGTWDRVLTALLAPSDSTGDLDWVVAIDSTIVRAHQHAAGGPHRWPGVRFMNRPATGWAVRGAG